jgi:hypothetical protein
MWVQLMFLYAPYLLYVLYYTIIVYGGQLCVDYGDEGLC